MEENSTTSNYDDYGDIIEELYGLGMSPNMGHLKTKMKNPFMASGMNRNRHQDEGPKHNEQCGHRLNGWQKPVYNLILRRGNAIVSVPPAAGKTMPILCAWKYEFNRFMSNIRNGRNIGNPPRIAIIVPTQQLAFQIGKQDFLRDKSSGLLRMIAENPLNFREFLDFELTNPGSYIDRDSRTGQPIRTREVGPDIGPELSDSRQQHRVLPDLKRLGPREIDQIHRMLIQDFFAIIYGGTDAKVSPHSNAGRKIFGKYKPIVVGTYEPMQALLKKSANEFDIIVIDETQQFLGTPGAGGESVGHGLLQKQKAFIEVINSASRSKNSSLLLLTGSTNDNTVEDIKSVVNHVFNIKPPMVKIPKNLPSDFTNSDDVKASKAEIINRTPIQINPIETMQSGPDLRKTCIDIVKNRQSNSIMLLFSIKGPVGGIISVINDINEKLPIINNGILTSKKIEGQSSDFSKIQKDVEHISRIEALEKFIRDNPDNRDKIEQARKIINKIKTRKHGSRFYTDIAGIKSVDDYDKYIKQKFRGITAAELADREGDDYIGDRTPSDLEGDTPQVDEIEYLKYFDIQSLEKGNYRNKSLSIPDPNNLLYQAALRGIGIMTGAMDQRHKETIQKLFKTGKLHLLFATDALGVGANVKCRHLYIPSLNKISEGGQFGPLDPSSLVQLVNRAGRGQFKVATVYCSSNDYERVKTLIEEDPRIAVDQIHNSPFGSLVTLAKEKGSRTAMEKAYDLLTKY